MFGVTNGNRLIINRSNDKFENILKCYDGKWKVETEINWRMNFSSFCKYVNFELNLVNIYFINKINLKLMDNKHCQE